MLFNWRNLATLYSSKTKLKKYSQFWANSLALRQEAVIIFFTEGVTMHFVGQTRR
jgi:hypothetical protein